MDKLSEFTFYNRSDTWPSLIPVLKILINGLGSDDWREITRVFFAATKSNVETCRGPLSAQACSDRARLHTSTEYDQY